jgi:hypothetical protein
MKRSYAAQVKQTERERVIYRALDELELALSTNPVRLYTKYFHNRKHRNPLPALLAKPETK